MNGRGPLNPPCIFVTSQNFIAKLIARKGGFLYVQ